MVSGTQKCTENLRLNTFIKIPKKCQIFNVVYILKCVVINKQTK